MTYFSREAEQRLDFNQNFDADANCRTGRTNWILPHWLALCGKTTLTARAKEIQNRREERPVKITQLCLSWPVQKFSATSRRSSLLSALLVIKASAFFLLLKGCCYCCCNTAAIKAEIAALVFILSIPSLVKSMDGGHLRKKKPWRKK